MTHTATKTGAAAGYPRTRILTVAVVILVAAGALAFRLPFLEQRPFHGDEANQAYKAGMLLDTGVYRYDPYEHHGPTLYYLFLPAAWLTGAKTFAETSEFAYRIVPVLFGAGIVLLALFLSDGIGPIATVAAAILVAISPAMVFYSRYFIQETFLTFFAFAAIGAGWRYYRTPRLAYAILTGVCLGLMHATKETCILAYAAIAAALFAALAYAWFRDKSLPDADTWRPWIRPVHLFALVLAAAMVSALLFSSFFTNPAGPLDSITAFGQYAERAGGEGAEKLHAKPWYYYLQLLIFFRFSASTWWSEGLIVGLAVIGIVAALLPAAKGTDDETVYLCRFLAFYAILLAAAYAVIPYKTPWCLINFLQPMTLLAGIGVAALFRWARFWPVRALVAVVLAVLAWHLGWEAWRATYVLHSDPRNPYVYAHPVAGMRRIVRRAHELAAVHPAGKNMVIKVIAPGADYWPLPFYLREFPNVGYWDRVPDNPDADMVIVLAEVAAAFGPHLQNAYQPEFHGLRPGVLMQVYIDQGLWDAFMATR